MGDDHFKRAFLTAEFEKRFGQPAEWIVRCPGRVNLIGEHVDYSGYGVLPMATAQSIYVAFGPNDNEELVLENTNEKYEKHIFDVRKEWTGCKNPKWWGYVLSGFQGAKDHLNSHEIRGLNWLVHGESSFTTLIGMTGKVLDGYSKDDIANVAIKCERLVGLEGGGMDQAVVTLAENNAALRIDFEPLKSWAIELPKNALFAVLHSNVESNKAATAHYNERVVECRIAAQDFQEKLGLSLVECEEMVEQFLQPSPYSREQIRRTGSERSGVAGVLGNGSTQEMETFHLHPRAKHVFAESARVHQFVEACEAGDSERMGEIMDATLTSPAATSTPAPVPNWTKIVVNCKKVGCKGARLTGAGWGGAAVALVDAADKERVEKELDILFWSPPAGGIEALRLDH
ncbi:hypothetical protein M3Y99_01963100 [Aphelenchoides fujianensis]|nr:hypothetical protein M3Y99_01963100 [Aphelenchoides fujianensis]